jgi:hypothetical protein
LTQDFEDRVKAMKDDHDKKLREVKIKAAAEKELMKQAHA